MQHEGDGVTVTPRPADEYVHRFRILSVLQSAELGRLTVPEAKPDVDLGAPSVVSLTCGMGDMVSEVSQNVKPRFPFSKRDITYRVLWLVRIGALAIGCEWPGPRTKQGPLQAPSAWAATPIQTSPTV